MAGFFRIFRTMWIGQLLLCFVVLSTPAKAQSVIEQIKKPMPEIAGMAEEEFLEKTSVIEEAPLDLEKMKYQIRLPKDWAKPESAAVSNYTISDKVLGEVTRYYSPIRHMGDRSYLSVQILDLEYDFTAEQWFIQYVLSNSYNLMGLTVHDDYKVEGLYVFIQDGISFVSRVVAQINDKRVMFVQYVLPTDTWKEESGLQASVLKSFTMQNIDHEPVEETYSHLFLDIAEIQYPISWDIRTEPVRSVDRMEVKLLNVASSKVIDKKRQLVLDGTMQVHLVSTYVAENLETELDALRKAVEDRGFEVQEPLDVPDDFKFHDSMRFGQVEAYQAISSKNRLLDYEYWVGLMSSGEYYYFVTLITPSRDDDFFVWARNIQTLKRVVASVRPLGVEE